MLSDVQSNAVGPGIVIVGAGAFGQVHAKALAKRQDANLVGVASRNTNSAYRFAADWDITAFSGLDAALEDPRAEAVVIATPHDTHADIAVRVLKAGRHVLVEKPIAHTLAGADAICTAADAAPAGTVCMIGHIMRYAPAYRRARRLIADGAIGDIVHMESHSVIGWGFDSRSAWHRSSAAGGGMWLTQGTHVIDRVSWLLDSRATAVCGVGRTAFHAGRQDADDFGAALLVFENGVTAQITIAGFTEGVTNVGTTVTGTRGQLRLSHRGDLMVGRGDVWEPVADNADTEQSWRDAMMDGEWAAFMSGIAAGSSPIPADYGRYVLGIALAAQAGKQGEVAQWM